MKSFEMLPTEENLIMSLKENILDRNDELMHFYNLLVSQECATSIAVDGRWGSGKTFYVKQTLLLINALNPMSKFDEKKREQVVSQFIFYGEEESGKDCNLAVYFDAWENDNDNEPVMSIIYEISKQLGLTYMFEEDTNVFRTAGAILETLSGRSVNSIIDNLKCDNPLSAFKKQRELEEKMKSFFTDILSERGNRLIVFVDELDRCKPSYAVHLLEQIKHYLNDDRITFVFSVNAHELQHTIKHYYGDDFDACRYLDRFFDLRISLPPVDKWKFYQKMGLEDSYALEKVCQRVIDVYNLELREIGRLYRQVRTAVYAPTHKNNGGWKFSFPEGQGRQFILMCLVPIAVGLKMVDISLYDDFISGKNAKPLIDVFNTEKLIDWFVFILLDSDESFDKEEGKKQVTVEEKLVQLYDAIFINEDGVEYYKNIGKYAFDAKSKQFLIGAASMLSEYVDYEV